LQLSVGKGVLFESVKLLPPFKSLRLNIRFVSAFLLPLLIVVALGFSLLRYKRLQAFAFLLVWVSAAILYGPNELVGVPYMTFPKAPILQFQQKLESEPADNFFLKEIDRERDNDLLSMLASNSNQTCLAPNFAVSPARRLKRAAVTDVQDGLFNFTNPSCFIYPEVNACRAMDRVTVEDIDNLEMLRRHKNPNWPISKLQERANLLSGVSVVGVCLLLLLKICSYVLTLTGRVQ
ncbi:hypothetical protein BVY02_02120, partial [bacterium J17]